MNSFAGTAEPSGTPLDKVPQPACAKFLGYRFLSVDRDAMTMRVAFSATEEMLNPRCNIQGGFLTAMMDDAMGSMIVVLTEGAKAPASVDIHTQFLAPAYPGALICEAQLVHMTKSTAFTRASLFDEKGHLIATATQTARLFDLGGARQ